MNKMISAFEAKRNFSKLLDRVENGDVITTTRRDQPVAKLVPVRPKHNVAAVMEAVRKLRELANEIKPGTFDWEELKKYRDEGRK
jgi:prevent-host-death family protein